MRTLILAFVLSCLASVALTRVVRDLAVKYGLYDDVGGRKLHLRPLPRLGGVGIALAFALPVIALSLHRNDISKLLFSDTALLISMVVGGGLMLGIGLYDDLKNARPVVKLAVQIVAALVVFFAGVSVDAIRIPYFGVLEFGYFALPVTVFWIVLVTNAVNLIDGLDGLAAGVVLIASGTMFVMAVTAGDGLAAFLLACMLGSTLGFLFFNVNPASIFLGDGGSLLLGFMLGLVSVHSAQKSTALFSIGAAILIFGLPLFDLSMAVVRRFLMGKPLFAADQHHVHHLLLRKGLSQRQTFFMLAGTAVLLEGLALLFIFADDRVSALVVVAIVGMGFVAFRLLGYDQIILSGRRTWVAADMERAAGLRAEAVRRAREDVMAAAGPAEIWQVLLDLADVLDLQAVELDLVGGERFAWDRSNSMATRGMHLSGVLHLEFTIGLDPPIGQLRITRFREHEVFAPHDDAMCQAVADAVAMAAPRWRGSDAGATSPDTHAVVNPG